MPLVTLFNVHLCLVATHESIKSSSKTEQLMGCLRETVASYVVCRFCLLNTSQVFETLPLEEMTSCLMAGNFTATKACILQTCFL